MEYHSSVNAITHSNKIAIVMAPESFHTTSMWCDSKFDDTKFAWENMKANIYELISMRLFVTYAMSNWYFVKIS